jgi:hypothetical protein
MTSRERGAKYLVWAVIVIAFWALCLFCGCVDIDHPSSFTPFGYWPSTAPGPWIWYEKVEPLHRKSGVRYEKPLYGPDR